MQPRLDVGQALPSEQPRPPAVEKCKLLQPCPCRATGIDRQSMQQDTGNSGGKVSSAPAEAPTPEQQAGQGLQPAARPPGAGEKPAATGLADLGLAGQVAWRAQKRAQQGEQEVEGRVAGGGRTAVLVPGQQYAERTTSEQRVGRSQHPPGAGRLLGEALLADPGLTSQAVLRSTWCLQGPRARLLQRPRPLASSQQGSRAGRYGEGAPCSSFPICGCCGAGGSSRCGCASRHARRRQQQGRQGSAHLAGHAPTCTVAASCCPAQGRSKCSTEGSPSCRRCAQRRCRRGQSQRGSSCTSPAACWRARGQEARCCSSIAVAETRVHQPRLQPGGREHVLLPLCACPTLKTLTCQCA